MNPNRKLSLETIINTPNNQFITMNMYSTDGKACAMGHVYRIHNCKPFCLSLEKEEITGLTENERYNIINLNDFHKIKDVKDYCRKLLDASN